MFESLQAKQMPQKQVLRAFVAMLSTSVKDCTCSQMRNHLRKYSTTNRSADQKFTHFGYQQVKEKDKSNKVYNVFENVANRYDLMNDLMSAGTHRLWKHFFVQRLNLKQGLRILDVAGGTGDIAFRMLDSSLPRDHSLPPTEIIVSDINKEMLSVGRKRADKFGIEENFQWVEADAESLPFDDDTMDLYTVSFGIRNMTRIDQVLNEAFRVLKPGGRFSCLEFSHVENPLIRSVYDEYSMNFIPVLGEIFASDWLSYQYLVESIRQFPTQEAFADLIYNAGFSNVTYENLTFGVVSIHDGFKL